MPEAANDVSSIDILGIAAGCSLYGGLNKLVRLNR